jgi:hypothetical protein
MQNQGFAVANLRQKSWFAFDLSQDAQSSVVGYQPFINPTHGLATQILSTGLFISESISTRSYIRNCLGLYMSTIN